MSAEARLKAHGITLPTRATPLANYIPAVQAGRLLYVSGHLPLGADGTLTARGKLGRDLTVEQGYQAARVVGLNVLGTVRSALGTLDRVTRVVKVLGAVASADGFGQQPQVINGFSDLMVEVFGDVAGKHARSAVGFKELPLDAAVEIEAVFEVVT